MVPALRRTLPLLLTVAAAVPGAPARAGDLPKPWEVHREVRSHVHDVLRELVRVPERIHSRHRAHLQVFLGGSSYYAPHRHHHSTYRFPVWVGGTVAYRPFDYCGDTYFGAPEVRFELWRDWGHDRHAHWCGDCRGYYPTGHRHGRHDGYDRYDRYDRYERYDRYDRDDWRWDGYGRGHHGGDHRGCDHGRWGRDGKHSKHGPYDRYDRWDRYRHGDRRHRCDRFCSHH